MLPGRAETLASAQCHFASLDVQTGAFADRLNNEHRVSIAPVCKACSQDDVTTVAIERDPEAAL
jgi:hypothetical protein